MSPKHREMGLLEKAEGLATTQQSFTTQQDIRLYGEVRKVARKPSATTRSSKISRCPDRS